MRTAWRRLTAFAVDYLVIALYMAVLAALSLTVAAPLVTSVAPPWQTQLLGFVTLTLPVILYFAVSEASGHGATLGKRLLGVRVTDLHGDPLPLSRSLLRSTVKFLPWELAHTAVHRLIFWTAEGKPLSVGQSVFVGVFYALSLLGAALYVLELLTPPYRPLYDRVSRALISPLLPQIRSAL